MNYIIFDLEATCDENKHFNKEIIEIGAVKITKPLVSHYIEETTFSAFVKPVDNPILTEFCKNLTSIEQLDVDTAKFFPNVISDFIEWMGTDYILCSWGFYDRFQLIKDLHNHRLQSDWVNQHISLKHQFADIYDMKPCSMKKALNIMNVPLNGTHHRGIDDAKNISKIFLKLFTKWNFNI